MTPRHTPEPWTAYSNSPGDDALPSIMATQPGGGGLFYVGQFNLLEDAKRAEACVNACKDIPNPAAVAGVVDHFGRLIEYLETAADDAAYAAEIAEARAALAALKGGK